jgi:GNAT superfamily N-acetyltransferase
MAGVVVRPARDDDAAAIARVHWQSWQETYAGLMPQALLDATTLELRLAQWPEWLAAHRQNAMPLVAELDGAVSGIALVAPARDPSLGTPLELGLCYVLAAAHRRGVGRALVGGCAGWLAARGGGAVGLWVVDGNDRAEAFYTAMGARRTGVVRTETVRGHELAEFAMAWDRLGDPCDPTVA